MIKDYREEILEIKKLAIEKVKEDAKELYNEHKKMMGILLLKLMELFERYSTDGKFQVNRYQREDVLREIKDIIIKESKALVGRDINISKNIFDEIISKSYEDHIGLLGSKGGFILTPILIEEITFREYKGATFNSRIIDNKRKLINKLYVEFDRGLINNATLVEISHNLQEIFKQSNYESYRLLMTEQARVFNEIQIKTFILSKMVDKVMWVSALCERTCPYCEMMDGSVYNVNDPNRPELPAHVLCQCCWIPV